MNGGHDKKFVVYCHENMINNKKYIGITCQTLEQRFRKGEGYKNSPHFYSAIKKYGWENFSHTVIYEDLSESEAKEKEIGLISEFNTRNPDRGYNMTPGGEGYSGEDNPWFGKHHTLENRKKMSVQRKGKKFSEEHRKKISDALKGRVFSDETREKMRKNHADFKGEKHPHYGRPFSPEHMKKFRDASKTPEAIAKMKLHKTWYSGADNPNAKRVICLDTGKIYDTVNDAAADNGCNPSKVSAVCHGAREHTRHLHFALYKEE